MIYFVTELCVLRTFGGVDFSLVFICVQSVSEFLWDGLHASIEFPITPKHAQDARFGGENGLRFLTPAGTRKTTIGFGINLSTAFRTLPNPQDLCISRPVSQVYFLPPLNFSESCRIRILSRSRARVARATAREFLTHHSPLSEFASVAEGGF